MHRIDQPTAVSSLPTPTAAGTPGYFSSATPGSGTPTVVDNDWCNDIQEELISILTAASITPSKTTHNQVLTALQSLFTGKGVVGTARNLKANVTSTTATTVAFTADEIIVETALGGTQYQLANFNQTLNIGTAGAGGMDTGSAPAPGFIAIYAIYNPATNTQSILATNATSAAAPSIYAGGHMPSGYTASALISVWGVTAGGYLFIGAQNDRSISIQQVSALSTSTTQSSYTSLSISGIVPQNAKSISGLIGAASSGAAAFAVAGTNLGVGIVDVLQNNGASITVPYTLNIFTPQTVYYTFTGSSPSCTMAISGYAI